MIDRRNHLKNSILLVSRVSSIGFITVMDVEDYAMEGPESKSPPGTYNDFSRFR